jgi:hypothetical protein
MPDAACPAKNAKRMLALCLIYPVFAIFAKSLKLMGAYQLFLQKKFQ